MNADDLATLHDLTVRTRNVIEHLRAIARIPPEADVVDVQQLLTKLEDQVGNFAEYVQQRELMSWERKGEHHRPRHPSNQYLRRPRANVDPKAHGVPVRRYDGLGNYIGETRG